MNKSKRTLVVVLGTHRGGTSVIARGLEVLGVDLGNHLMPPGDENPKGYWEDLDINLLNIEILSFLKRDWHSLAPIQPMEVDALYENGYFQRAVELLNDKTKEVQIFGFKDPRVAKLLPFWKKVIADGLFQAHYILAIRHPLSVCESLSKRDGFEREKGYLLWLEHVLNSFVGTQGESRVLVDYDHLMQSPQTDMERIARQLQMEIIPTELERFKQDFLENELRHTIYQIENLSLDESPPLVLDIYSQALNIINDGGHMEDPAFKNKVAQWDKEFTRMKALLILADKYTTEIQNLRRELAGLAAQLAKQDARLAKRDAQLVEIQSSKTWRTAKLLERIRTRLAPPGSWWSKLIEKAFSATFFSLKRGRDAHLQEDMNLIRSSDLYDEKWYLENNPRIIQIKMDPVQHYLRYGGFKRRDPGPNFSNEDYLESYPDVKKTGINPLVHYLSIGQKEGRLIHPSKNREKGRKKSKPNK